ncbi:unnamed protein product [Trichobilharzia szidati]|nr:unnamed protein product [Trichobilharzia szidati]
MLSKGQVEGQPASSVALPDLRWDAELAHYAARLAQTCNPCYDTSAIPKKKGEYVRQNIAPVDTVEEAVDYWWNRHLDYDYATKNCSDGKKCRHYLKVKLSKILIFEF